MLIIDDEADNASIQSLSKREFEQWDEAIDLLEENPSEADQENLIRQGNLLLKPLIETLG